MDEVLGFYIWPRTTIMFLVTYDDPRLGYSQEAGVIGTWVGAFQFFLPVVVWDIFQDLMPGI